MAAKLINFRGNITQVELARNLSVSVNRLRSWEQGKKTPEIQEFLNICLYLEKKPDDFIELTNELIQPEINYEKLSFRLQLIRQTTLKISQDDFAKSIGISKATLQKYESGHRIPPLLRVISICTTYNISLNYLLGTD